MKRHEKVTWLLNFLVDSAVETGEILDAWSRHRSPINQLDDEHAEAEWLYQQRREAQKRLAYLKKKELIRVKRTEGKMLIELTNEGRVTLFERLIEEREELPNEHVCLVMYDIPNDAKSGRDALRYFLRRIGFTQIQRSVWQTRKNVVEEVSSFVDQAGLSEWVLVFVGKKM